MENGCCIQDGDVGNPRHLQIRLLEEGPITTSRSEENKYFRLTQVQRDIYTGTYSGVVETTNYTLDAEDEFIRENLGVYELILEARELPLHPGDNELTLMTRTGVAVMIQDVDDHIPTFNPPQFTRILRIPFTPNENWVFPDFRVEVEDADVEPANSVFDLQFEWSVKGIPVEDVFSFITPSNDHPKIQSKGIVTMEVLNISLLAPGSMIDLQIGAYQNGYLVSNLNVPIEVAPGQKVKPSFSQNVYRISIPEDISEGQLITTVTAKNHDTIEDIKYSLIGVGSERFIVDEDTGEIRCGVKDCVDFEREKSHFFLIRAKTGDTVEDEDFAILDINVTESNDNYPEFVVGPVRNTNTSVVIIRRVVPDGTKAFDPPFIIQATDQDLEDEITYEVIDKSVPNSGITIDPNTGELKLEKALKWIEAGEHRLIVTATDKTGKSSEQPVLLTIQAVKNIPPSFSFKTHRVEIPETVSAGSPIFTASAHDPDGQDKTIKYFIEYQPEADLFIIEESSGTIRVNGKLDYETKQKLYPLKLRAQDEGKPSQTAAATVEIKILDVNEEKPKFSEKNYVVDMSESSMPDIIVMKLKATDGDANSQLVYDISCPCNVWEASGAVSGVKDAETYFQNLRVDPNTGEIILVDTFEHKKTAVLEFQAIVHDVTAPAPNLQNDTATVSLYITAAERDRPIFGHPWTSGNPWINLTVPEDIELGSTVVTLNAWDYMEEEPIGQFQLVDSDSENFVLEGNEIKVVTPLDYEEVEQFMLSVKAIDIRGGQSIANLVIKVIDVNDNAPVFSKLEYKGKVIENSVYPTPILTVEASDADDSESYGAIRYALTGPQSHLFTIDELAGVVQVAPGADIDREKDSTHKITVLAMDTPKGGPFQRTATATLQISVIDVNDNDPKCSESEELLIPENAPIKTSFGNITCTDPDESSDKILFQMKDESKLNLFGIDPLTGQMFVAKSLRGRGRNNPYVVTIVVEDGKERTVSIAVPIKVTNVIPNDGKPFFTNENYTAIISEGAGRGSPVFVVKAFDTDSYDNGEGRLHFTLMKQIYPCNSKLLKGHVTSVREVDFFRLDTINGQVTLKDAIDRETYDCFSVLVGVEDSGVPSQGDTAWFEVHIMDIDDSMPFVPKDKRNVDLFINETTSVGNPVYSIVGEDRDAFPNNLIHFEISGGGTDLFKIVPNYDQQSATLVLQSDLTQMEHNELTIVVKCYPKDKKITVPDCIAKLRVHVVRDADGLIGYTTTGSGSTPEMLLGVAAGTPVGNLIGNAGISSQVKKLKTSIQMFHPGSVSQSPYNVSEVIRVDSETGDIYVWDNLEQFQNGHIRILMSSADGTTGANSRKNLKVFIAPNDNLLSADMLEFAKISRWLEETDGFLNNPLSYQRPMSKKGIFKTLTYDQSNSIDGKTRLCFQLLENENMVSQKKALQLLENGDLQDIFLKFSFDEIQKGCPQRARVFTSRQALTSTTGRFGFWVERSLLGIASVVAIATISAILILCLVNRSRNVKNKNHN